MDFFCGWKLSALRNPQLPLGINPRNRFSFPHTLPQSQINELGCPLPKPKLWCPQAKDLGMRWWKGGKMISETARERLNDGMRDLETEL